MSKDIVERLLNRAANAVIIKEKPNLYYDAAHEIERLRAENEKLREALSEAEGHLEYAYTITFRDRLRDASIAARSAAALKERK